MERVALACFGDSDDSLARLSMLITSFANFTVQYNFSCISMALIMMSQGQCTSDDGNCASGIQAEWVEGASEAGIFIGAVVGEICFGYLGDYFGRSEAMILAMSIAFVSIFISSFLSLGSAVSVYAVIIFFRFVAGIGLGGMFPLAATKASEDASHHAGKVNAKASSWSFFWQLPALLLPYILGILLSDSTLSPNARWRVVLGFGLIPCFFTLVTLFLEQPLRAKRLAARQQPFQHHQQQPSQVSHVAMNSFSSQQSQTKPLTHDNHFQELQEDVLVPELPSVSSSTVSTTSPHHSSHLFQTHSELTMRQVYQLLRNEPSLKWKLLSAGGSWFLYDIVVYGLGLLSTYTISAITDDDGNISSSKSVRVLCEEQLIALSAIIPATILSIYLVPLLGLKYLQMLGFFVQGVCCLMVTVAFPFLHLGHAQVLFGLYCVVYASLNFGSGITTFTLPAALFPREIRTTFNGLAAAMGKVGAVVSTFSFYLIAETAGYPVLLGLCAGVAFFGCWFTYVMIDETALLSEENPVFEHHPHAKGGDVHATNNTGSGNNEAEVTHNVLQQFHNRPQ